MMFINILQKMLKQDLTLQLDRPSPKGKNKKVFWIMKDKIGREIMKEFVGSRAKIYSYLKDNKMKSLS